MTWILVIFSAHFIVTIPNYHEKAVCEQAVKAIADRIEKAVCVPGPFGGS